MPYLPPKRRRDEGSRRFQVPDDALGSEAREVLADLSKGRKTLEATLDKYLSRPGASLEVLRVCLQHALQDMKKLPRRQRHKILSQRAVGRRILQYLWKDDPTWMQFVFREVEARHHLVYFLIGEGAENLVIDWLFAELTAQHDEFDFAGNAVWRGQLLRDAMWAHLMLDSVRSADEALRCYFQVVDAKDKEQALHNHAVSLESHDGAVLLGPILKTSMWPATVELRRALGSGEFPKTNPELYSRFIAFMNGMKSRQDETSRRYANALLHLRHPGAPNAAPAVAFFRRHHTNVPITDARSRLPSSPLARRTFREFAHRTVSVAKENGTVVDLEWLKPLIVKLFDEDRHI